MNDLIKDDNIETMIYEIRGKQVMLDSDLAGLYHCKNGTKSINLAVSRHTNRFPERFMFQLTDDESKIIWFQIETKYGKVETRGGKYNQPYVFTEQGVAMLATVLKTDVAEEVSIRIMDAFVSMRHYLNKNQDIYKSISNINNKLIEHDDKLKYIFDKFEYKGELIKVNKSYEAYSSITDLIDICQNELIIIDPYADKKILDLIKDLNISIILITSNKSKLNDILLNSFNKEHTFKIIYDNSFHDRYIILDKKEIYLCGTSINYIGNKISTIIKMESESIKDYLLYEIDKLIL